VDVFFTEWGIRIVGILGLLFILYSLILGRMSAQGLPDGYRGPVLALELVKSGADIKQIVGAESGRVAGFLKGHTYKDFGFIVVYLLFFVAVGLLVSQMYTAPARYIACFAAGCAVLGGILDVVENMGMLRAIGGEATDSLANTIRYVSLSKWALLFLFSLLVGLLMIPRGFFAPAGGLLLFAAVLGFSGVFLNLFRPKFYWTFDVAVLTMGLVTIFLTIVFIFWPAKVLSKLVR
jgi:hypothetical protein